MPSYDRLSYDAGFAAGLEAASKPYRCDWCGRSWRFRVGYWLHWKFLGEVR